MEKRQRAAGFGPWERPVFGNPPAEAPRYPPHGNGVLPPAAPGTDYPHGRSPLTPDASAQPAGPWHNTHPSQGPRPGLLQHPDPGMGFTQHGTPQYCMYTQRGPSPDSFHLQPLSHHGHARAGSMPPPPPMLQARGDADLNYGGHKQGHINTPHHGQQQGSGQGASQQGALEYRRETQGIVRDGNRQSVSHQGETSLNIPQHADPGTTISPQDAQKSEMSRLAGSLSKDAHYDGRQHGQLHMDPSHRKNNEPHMYPSHGSQFGAAFSDMVHQNSVQQHPFGDRKPGISSLGGFQTRQLPNDASPYRAPSPGIVQQLPTMPIQTAPYVHNNGQGHHNFPPPPFHGSLTNPFIAPPPVGHVFSGFHKEADSKVLHHQPHDKEPQNGLNQERLNMPRYENKQQKHSHFQPNLVPGQAHPENIIQQYKSFSQSDGGSEGPFLRHDIADLQRDPRFVPPHRFIDYRDRLFAPPNTHNLQVEDNLIPLKGKSGADDKDAFQHWLSCFLACKRKEPPPEPDATQPISITEARGLIYGTLQLVSQLDSLCQTLENSDETGESWMQDYEKASDVRNQLERQLKELEKPGYIQCVKKKLDRVRKKRHRCQRRREAAEEEEKEAKERAAEKEANIETWRLQCIQAVEEKKRERELKTAADSVLAEVRKKQTDGKKMLDVLKSLEKLRKLRKEAAGRKGVFPPASADNTFKNHIDRLRTMVHKRIALYDAEERALRVILEGEQEEERQRDKDKRLKKEKEKVLQKQQELDSILFGDPDLLPNLHPLQPFRQYYLQAEHSVVSLVQIRRAWDQFLVPPDHSDASSIPRGWVVPTSPSSDVWATALKQAE